MENVSPGTYKIRSSLWVVLAYLVAFAIAALVLGFFPEGSFAGRVLAADLVATFVIFGFSYYFNNSSMYDAYWSVIPIAVAVWAIAESQVGVPLWRQALVGLGVAVWGIRLTYNWWRGWKGMKHQDWRYVDLQAKMGKAYWWVSFSGIHLFPTILVFLGMMSLYPALYIGTQAFNAWDVAGLIAVVLAIYLEAGADAQLRRYVLSKPAPGSFLQTGLWAYSRHPNYMGEMLFWWSLYFFGLAADPSYAWTIIGPLAMMALFYFISIPMIEKRMLRKRPAYADYRTRVPMAFPGFGYKKREENSSPQVKESKSD